MKHLIVKASAFLCAFCLVMSFSMSPAYSGEKTVKGHNGRPVVALVLSGGGAKGTAHIGALKYLDSLGYDFDMVVGTSMGSIVGALYSLGYTPYEIDSLARVQDWSVLISDKALRSNISYKDKKYQEKFLVSVSFDLAHKIDSVLAFGAGSSDISSGDAFFKTLPSGFVSGQNIFNLFTGLSVGYQDSLDFDRLPIPFACVATDLVTGDEIVFREGKVPVAIRASMAIPGYFSPVREGKYILVDGGTQNNFPVDVARDMGADIVVGVDVSGDLLTYSEINNIGDIAGQLISLMSAVKYRENVPDADVYIRPDIKGYGSMSFDHASIDTLIDRGYRAAAQHDRELRELLDTIRRDKGYSPGYAGGQHLNARPAVNVYNDTIMLKSVSILGVTKSERAWLKRNMDLPLYQSVSGSDIDNLISSIYSTEAFKSVTYELVGNSNPYEMRIFCEKGNPHKVGVGARFDTEEIAAVLLYAGFNDRRLTGSKYGITARLSMNPYVKFDYSYAMPKMPRLNLTLSARSENADIRSGADKAVDMHFYKFDASAFISNISYKTIDISAGMKTEGFYFKSFLTSSDIVGDYDITQTMNSYVSAFASGRADSMNDAYFPTSGFSAGLDYSFYFTGFYEAFKPFHQVSFDAQFAFSLSDMFTVMPSIYGRFLFGNDIPLPYMNVMGGLEAGRYLDQQFAFVGTQSLNIFRQHLTALRCDIRANVSGNHYVSLMANYARDCETFKDYFKGPGYLGAGLQYSFKSMIGPISASVYWSSYTKSIGAYVSLGYYF